MKRLAFMLALLMPVAVLADGFILLKDSAFVNKANISAIQINENATCAFPQSSRPLVPTITTTGTSYRVCVQIVNIASSGGNPSTNAVAVDLGTFTTYQAALSFAAELVN